MRIGVIIVCHNDEKNIDTNFCIEHLNQAKNLELCLVNNASRDKTHKILKEIKDLSLINVSIVDIKKFKSDTAAVRSGARFMFNQFDLNHIGFVSTNMLNIKKCSINDLIKYLVENQDVILNHNIEVIEKSKMKQTLFQSVFSITEYLEKLKINNRIISLQY